MAAGVADTRDNAEVRQYLAYLQALQTAPLRHHLLHAYAERIECSRDLHRSYRCGTTAVPARYLGVRHVPVQKRENLKFFPKVEPLPGLLRTGCTGCLL